MVTRLSTPRKALVAILVLGMLSVLGTSVLAHDQTYTTTISLAKSGGDGSRTYTATLGVATPNDGQGGSCTQGRAVVLENDANTGTNWVPIAPMTGSGPTYTLGPIPDPLGKERATAVEALKTHGTYPFVFTHTCSSATSNER